MKSNMFSFLMNHCLSCFALQFTVYYGVIANFIWQMNINKIRIGNKNVINDALCD